MLKAILIISMLCLRVVGGQAAEHLPFKQALDTITVDELQHHVYTLSDDSFEGREGGTQGGRAAGVYVAKALSRIQCRPGGTNQYFQPFGAGLRNVLGLVSGTNPELRDEIVLVGAHYDHIGFGNKATSNGPTGYIHNGADDNASGVAALLEVAQALQDLPDSPQRSVLFAFWDGEEKGLLGSKHWVEHPTRPLDRVVTAINVDMIGRLSVDGLEVSGTRTAGNLRQWVSRRNMVTDLKISFPWKTNDSSDHWPFYIRGVPVIVFHTGLHDDYHSPSDDAHLINLDGMHQVTELLFRCLVDLADAPAPHAFRHRSRQEGEQQRKHLERKLADAPPRLGISWSHQDQVGSGLLITRVAYNSAAHRAGLQIGDRMLQWNSETVNTTEQFQRLVQMSPTNSVASVQRPNVDQPIHLEIQMSGHPLRLGISWRGDIGEPGSVVLVRVAEGSPAEHSGLKPLDRVYEVNGQRFSNGEHFGELASNAALPATLLVERWGRLREFTLQPSSVHKNR